MKNICIIGATGSIGTQTIDVIKKQKDKFNLVAISANKNYEKTISTIEEFNPKFVVITDKDNFCRIKDYCFLNNINTEVLYGKENLNLICTLDEVDMVVTSVVGMVGLVPTVEAIRKGKDIALANKETLVAGGHIVMKEAKKNKVKIIPVDSEHGAIFQCLQGNDIKDLDKILLTASGGPFRGKKREELLNITPRDAVNHPNWNMGKKISIDSSTLMNKGLEVIEAHWLFDVSYDKIQVVVHPESIIHSAVQYKDGSVIAQLAIADMRLPIQYALNYPLREESIIKEMDLFSLGNLSFEKPDLNTFKCLKIAYEVGKIGGIMPSIMNSANEAAVDLFLKGKIKYLQIQEIIEECLNKFENLKEPSLEEIVMYDKKVKQYIYNKRGE